MKILNNVNFNLKEIVNSETATTPINTMMNKEVIATGLLVGLKEDIDNETGEVKTLKVGVIKIDEGNLLSTISPTVINSIETIVNAYTDADMLGEIKEGIAIAIKSAKSGKNRDFIFLELL